MSDTSLRRAVLLVATMGGFLTPFMGSSINVALPTIGRDLGLNAVTLSWVPMAFSLAAAMFLLPFGKLADIYGRKRIYTTGMATFTLSSILCAVAPTGAFLILARALQGAAGAMTFSTAAAMLTSAYPPGERGRVLGINTATVYVGLSVGPTLGGILTQQLGWRSLFLICGVVGVLILIVISTRLHAEWAEAKGERFDVPGAVIYGVALAMMTYGGSLLPAPGGWALIVSGILALVVFVFWERRSRSPLLDLALFVRSRVFGMSNLAALINYAATSAVGFLLSLYLQYVRGLTLLEAGLILVAQPIVQAVFSPLAGWLSDRVESRIVASAGMMLNVLGLLLLTLLGPETPRAAIVGCLMLMGLGFGLFSSPNTNAVMGAVEKRYLGVASATLSTMRTTGQLFSLSIATLLLAVFVGPVQITAAQHPAFLASMRTTFGLFAALCLVGVAASLARGKMVRSPVAPQEILSRPSDRQP